MKLNDIGAKNSGKENFTDNRDHFGSGKVLGSQRGKKAR